MEVFVVEQFLDTGHRTPLGGVSYVRVGCLQTGPDIVRLCPGLSGQWFVLNEPHEVVAIGDAAGISQPGHGSAEGFLSGILRGFFSCSGIKLLTPFFDTATHDPVGNAVVVGDTFAAAVHDVVECVPCCRFVAG